MISTYELCEVVDLDYDGVCELLLAETYYEGRSYQVYKMVSGKMQLILDNTNVEESTYMSMEK